MALKVSSYALEVVIYTDIDKKMNRLAEQVLNAYFDFVSEDLKNWFYNRFGIYPGSIKVDANIILPLFGEGDVYAEILSPDGWAKVIIDKNDLKRVLKELEYYIMLATATVKRARIKTLDETNKFLNEVLETIEETNKIHEEVAKTIKRVNAFVNKLKKPFEVIKSIFALPKMVFGKIRNTLKFLRFKKQIVEDEKRMNENEIDKLKNDLRKLKSEIEELKSKCFKYKMLELEVKEALVITKNIERVIQSYKQSGLTNEEIVENIIKRIERYKQVFSEYSTFEETQDALNKLNELEAKINEMLKNEEISKDRDKKRFLRFRDNRNNDIEGPSL